MAVAVYADGQSRWRRVMDRRARLWSERASWDAHWQDLADNYAPRKARFTEAERNRGTKKNDKIVNLSPIRALRVATAGMVAGLASPEDVWFGLTTDDPDLAEFWSARAWLETVRDRMLTLLGMSNFYRAQTQMFKQLLVFATTAAGMADDPEKVCRFHPFPIGTYALANDGRNQVSTLYRDTSVTTEQARELFNPDHMGDSLLRAIEQKRWDDWHNVLHVVEPRDLWERGRYDTQGMRWSSCWYEKNASDVQEPLEEKGFEECPVLAVRWDTDGEDVYGSDSPGMDALGTVKELYHAEKRSAQGLDKLITPTMVGPTSLRTGRATTLSGDITYVDVPQGGQGYAPAYQVQPFWEKLEIRQARLHQQVLEAFHADIWLGITEDAKTRRGGPPTAEEVRERHGEKILQLGPVVTNTQSDLHSKLIQRLFGQMLRAGLVPPPPQELRDTNLKVKFLGYFAQAQQTLKVGTIERHSAFVLQLAELIPSAAEKFDEHEAVEAHAQALGVPPKVTRSDEAVAAMQQQRQAAQQTAMMAEAAKGAGDAAGAAKDLSEADVQGDNALTRLTKKGAAGMLPPGAAA